jgi:choloylglycine hydrolase
MGRVLAVAVLLGCLAAVCVDACTGVALVRDGAIVVGGNEDNGLANPAMWATAASDSAYGVAYLGFWFEGLGNRLPGWYEMQGVNDQGLYYDLFSMPCGFDSPVSRGAGWRGPGYPMPEAIERTMMTTCATVGEALAFLHARDYARILPCVQVLFVDRAGNVAVYTGDGDVFRTTPGFVVTNFNLVSPSLGGYPCPRYNIASRLMGYDASPSLDRVAQILRAARIQPASPEDGGTRYSVVCDLVNGIADVYLNGNFADRARLELAELWAQGRERVLLTELKFVPSGLP